MDFGELLNRILSIEVFAHQWGLVAFALALILYRVLAGRIRWLPPLPTGFLLAYLALRFGVTLLPPGLDPRFLIVLDVASAIFLYWAGVRILFMLTVGIWYWWRKKTVVPKITRDLILFAAYALIVLVVLRTRGGVNLVGLITTSAVLTAVIGLAAQNFLGNLFSGLSIQVEQPFRIGDWIEYGNYQGKVVHIGWEAAHIKTFDDELIIIPNLDLAKSVIKNHSRPTIRHAMKIEIGVEYGAAPGRVREVLLGVCREEPRVLAEPTPVVRVTTYGDFAITYQIRFFYNDFGFSPDLRADMMNRIWYALRRAGIMIPFPIRDVQHHHVERRHAEEKRRLVREKARLALAAVPILKPLAADAIATLAEGCAIEEYGSGEIVVHQGDPGDALYLIHAGSCDIEVQSGSQPPAVVAALSAPAFFGEMSLLTGEPRSATVRARGDAVVFAIGKELFREVLAAHPEVSGELAHALAARQAETAGVVGRLRDEDERQASRILSRIKTFFGI